MFFRQPQFIGPAYSLLAGTLFGGVGFIASFILKADVPVHSLMFWRFSIMFILLLPFVIRSNDFKHHSKKMFMTFFVGLALRASGMFLYFLSLTKIGISIATPIYFLFPVFVALISWVIGREKFSLVVFGSLILAGIGLLFISYGASTTSALGIFMAFCSSVLIGMTMVADKKFTPYLSGFTSSAMMALGVAVIAGIVSLSNHTLIVPQHASVWHYTLILILLCTIIPFTSMFVALKHMQATHVSLTLMAIEPLVSIVLGVTVLNEVLTSKQLLGIVLLLFGAAAPQIRSITKSKV